MVFWHRGRGHRPSDVPADMQSSMGIAGKAFYSAREVDLALWNLPEEADLVAFLEKRPEN
jgi:hypothetical protein